MKITKAIARIKMATHDAVNEYPESHCLDFLNNAIQKAASMLIAGGYLPMIQEMTLKDGDRLPSNYMKMCGKYPISVTGGKVTIVDDNEPYLDFRYYATPKALESAEGDLPFDNDAINEAVVSAAIMLALNENEFDVSTEAQLLADMQNVIAQGMGYGG